MTHETSVSRGLGAAAAVLGVSVSYYLGAQFGLLLRLPPAVPSVVWPPNAILTAVLLIVPPARWWIFLLAAFPAHLAVELKTDWPTALVLMLFFTNCSEAVLAASGVRWLSDAPTRFDTLRRVVVFIVAAVIAAPFLSSFLDAAAVATILGEPYWAVWQTRLFSNTLTELTFVPVLVMAATSGRGWLRAISAGRPLEAGLLAGSLLVVATTVFLGPVLALEAVSRELTTPFPLVLPFMLWAAVRFGPAAASGVLLVTALFAISGAAHGHGPFVGRVLPLQIFLSSLAIPLMCLAALIEERRRTEDTIRKQLSFEELLSQLSASFVHPHSHSLDWAFETWLRRFGEFLRVDQIQIFSIVGDQRELVAAYAWTDRDGGDDASTEDQASAAPARRSSRATPGVQAVGDGSVVAPRAIASSLSIPLEAGGDIVGTLWLGKCGGERAWSTDLVHRLGMVAQVFGYALARHQADDDRRASEAMRAAILASLPSRVAVLDRDGRVVAVNERWMRQPCTLPMWDAGLGVGASYITVGRERTRQAGSPAANALAGVEAVLSGARPSFTLEYACGDAVADRYWFAMSVVPLNRVQGGVVISHTDVTERKRAEADAEQSRRELAHFTRVMTVGELTASLAHELNQPLTGIRTNAEAARRLLSMTPLDRVELDQALADIIEDDKRAGSVINRLRDFLRKGEPERMPLDINALIHGVAKLLNSDALVRNVTISLELEPELPIVSGDSVQLQQVVLNLILNGMDAIGELAPGEHRLCVRTDCADETRIHVAVEDTGPGLRRGFEDRVFEPFYTTKREGMGMGLAIARSIIHAHGGDIWAANNTGGGAVFHFTLPLARPTAA